MEGGVFGPPVNRSPCVPNRRAGLGSGGGSPGRNERTGRGGVSVVEPGYGPVSSLRVRTLRRRVGVVGDYEESFSVEDRDLRRRGSYVVPLTIREQGVGPHIPSSLYVCLV